ncbi:MAG: LuxR C-terminal-related transcriptional regulator [Chloroflexota bacterium]
MRLTRPDYEAVWEFLREVDDLAPEEPYPAAMLARLRSLVASDQAAYQELDIAGRRFVGLTPAEPDDGDEDDEELYWTVGPCPITDYRVRTGDLSALRMSDVIGRARYHESPFYREYLKPVSYDHVLDLGLAADRQRYRSIALIRGDDAADFSERDRAVLELLRPHLRAREARAELQRRVVDTSWAAEGDTDGADAALTAREREILRLVREGKTNTEIAGELWVSPGTVKKHLEHVYEKLGVASRAAAATAAQAVSAR